MARSLKAGILWLVFVPPSPRLEQALGQHVWDEEKKKTESNLQERTCDRLWLQHLSPGHHEG